MGSRVGRPSSVELAPFGVRLRSLIKASPHFTSRAAFLRSVDVEGPTAYHWEKGERLPNTRFLLDAAEKLETSVDYLLGISDAGGPNPYPEWARFLQDAEKYGFELTEDEIRCLAAIRLPSGKIPDRQWYVGTLNSIRMLPEQEAEAPTKAAPASSSVDDSSPDLRR